MLLYTHGFKSIQEVINHVMVSEQFYDRSEQRLWSFHEMRNWNDHAEDGDPASSDHGGLRPLRLAAGVAGDGPRSFHVALGGRTGAASKGFRKGGPPNGKRTTKACQRTARRLCSGGNSLMARRLDD